MKRGDRGSTLPLILGFFLVGLLAVAGSVAAADAFVQQRGLQDVCDGAAAAAAGSAADLSRGYGVAAGTELRFSDTQQAAAQYLAQDPARAGVHATATVAPDGRTVTLTCTETATVAFGAMFGKGSGVHHTARASARAPLT